MTTSPIDARIIDALTRRLGFDHVSDKKEDGRRDVFWGDELSGRDTTLSIFTSVNGETKALLHFFNASRSLKDGKRLNEKNNVTYTLHELGIDRPVNLPFLISLTQEHIKQCHDAAHGSLSRYSGRIAQELARQAMGADDHDFVSSYTSKKGIAARRPGAPDVHHQKTQDGDSLCVPLYQLTRAGGVLRCHLLNRQIITTDDGGKRTSKQFLKGVSTKGLCYPLGLGFDPQTQTLSVATPKRIFICEGYATASTVHESTGQPTIAALNAGNMGVVAAQVARLFPSAEIALCADNDVGTERKRGNNPGKDAAKRAAQQVQLARSLAGTPLDAQPQVHVIAPAPADLNLEAIPKPDSDFNDAWSKKHKDALRNGTSADAAHQAALAHVRAIIADGLKGGEHAIQPAKWRFTQCVAFERAKQDAAKEQLLTFSKDLNAAVGPGFASLVSGAASPGFAPIFKEGRRAACPQTLRLNAPGASIMAAASQAGIELGAEKSAKFERVLGPNWGIECVLLHSKAQDGRGSGAVWPFWLATQRDKSGNTIKALPLTNADGKHFMQPWLMKVIGQAKNYTQATTPYKADIPAHDAAFYEKAASLRALQRVCSASKTLYLNMAPQPQQPCKDVWEIVTSVHALDDVMRQTASVLAAQDVHLLRRFTLDASGITVSKRMDVFLGGSAPDAAKEWLRHNGMKPHNVAGSDVYTCESVQLEALVKHLGVDVQIQHDAYAHPIRVVHPEYFEKLLPSAAHTIAMGKLSLEEFKRRLAQSDMLRTNDILLQPSAMQSSQMLMQSIQVRRSLGIAAQPVLSQDTPNLQSSERTELSV